MDQRSFNPDHHANQANAAMARGYDNSLTAGALKPQEVPVTDEAERALSGADAIHSALHDLEFRLFGPTLQGVAIGSDAKVDPSVARPPIARTVRNARQRIESASERLNAIIARL